MKGVIDMFLQLLLWMVIGAIATFVVSAIHLVRAESKGYNALEWWNKHGPAIFRGCTPSDVVLKTLFGLVIWPIRLLSFVLITVPELYKHYKLRV